MTVNPIKSEDKAVGSHPAVVFGKRDELRLLVNSRHPILTIETSEEERVEQMLFEVASELTVPLFTWSVTTGLARYHGAPIYNSDPPEAALSNMAMRSEEHTSELQSPDHLVCRLLLEKKKRNVAPPLPMR